MKKITILSALLFGAFIMNGQTIIYELDFDSNNTGYTLSYDDSASTDVNDYFRVTDENSISEQFFNDEANFFAANDIDGISGSPNATQTLVISNIDVTGYTNLTFSIDIAEGDDGSNEDWDNNDYFHVDYNIDNSSSENLIWIENDGTQYNTAPYIDLNFNGDGEGTEITDTFTTFTNSITGGGASLTLTLTFRLDSGDEDIAIDNILVKGTASSSSTTYTYDNGTWSPANPVGNSTAADDINVVSGTPAFTGDLTIKDITVQSGATLDLGGNAITVHGDISGAVTVNTDGSSLVFAGSTAQTMNIGGGAIALDDLTINNTAGVTLTNTNISLKGTLHLTAGQLTQDEAIVFAYDINDNTVGVVATVSSGSITGAVNIENYYPAQRAFRFMTPSVDMDGTIYENWQVNGSTNAGEGFAITGGTAGNGFDQSATNNPSMYTFSNDANQDWNAVTSTNNPTTDSPEAGTPYRVMVRGDRTVSITTANAAATATTVNTTGTLKTGDVLKTYPNTLTTDQFIFVGNPYQARVDVGAVLADGAAAGFKNAMYVWNPQAGSRGAYRLYSYSNSSTIPTDNEVDGIIQPGQAFFLEVEQPGTAVAPTITFKESHKVVGNAMNATYSLPQAQVVMNLFKGNETSARDGFRIQMDANYNAAGDANDFTKLYNLDENIAIVDAGNTYILEQRPMAQDGEVINLEVSNFESGSYTMDFNLNGLGYINTYLHDAFTNDYIELSNGNQAVTVVFDANQPASMDAARFSLVFSNTTLSMSDNAFAKAVALYPNPTNDGLFYIAGIDRVEAVAVAVINTLGQELRGVSPKVMDGTISVNLSAAPSGVYFVVIKNGGNSVIRRVIKQ
jgi:hypothetical protein